MSFRSRLHNWLRQNDAGQQRRQPVMLDETRLVVVDVETTGLQVRRDALISIGAVVIDKLRLDLTQQFEQTLCVDTTRGLDNILIHGISPSQIAHGGDPRTTLIEFSDFIEDSPLFAFHAPFDQAVLQRAYRQYLDIRLRNQFIDIADLAPALFPQRRPRQETLDGWLQQFGLSVSLRHHAAADALAAGELLLLLLKTARRQGINDLTALLRKLELNRRLRSARGQGV